MSRITTLERKTSETSIVLRLNLDGRGESRINTGLGFLNHMLTSFSKHGRIDLALDAEGDIGVDDHHTVEDTALALGAAVAKALGDGRRIMRFGESHVVMDEALSRCVIDISGRPFSAIVLDLRRERIGDVSCENIEHFFRSFSYALGCGLHLDTLRGANDHHKAEAAFKAFARSLCMATRLSGFDDIASTKGSTL